MDRQLLEESASRFIKYVEGLTSVMGHAHRAASLRDYCAGLLTTEGRKSVEPLAAVTAPAEVSVQHQRLLHFVAESPWSDSRLLTKVRELVLPAMERREPIKVWIIDDTSFPKQGKHSVGVHHQYCGELGKQANCQVAVTLSVANHNGSLPIAYRLYLPEKWAEDATRRKKAHIPEHIEFMTKPQIALEQIRQACTAGIPRGVVLCDAGYGVNAALRSGVSALGLSYVAGITATIKVRAVSNCEELGARISVKDLAVSLPKHAWCEITWREGTNTTLRSRFARVQVRMTGLTCSSVTPASVLRSVAIPAPPEAMTWISIEPGFVVTSPPDHSALAIDFNVPRRSGVPGNALKRRC
jgi:SRSO17 transposase